MNGHTGSQVLPESERTGCWGRSRGAQMPAAQHLSAGVVSWRGKTRNRRDGTV